MLVGWDAFYVPRWTSGAVRLLPLRGVTTLYWQSTHTYTAEASAKATQLLASLKWIQDSAGNPISLALLALFKHA